MCRKGSRAGAGGGSVRNARRMRGGCGRAGNGVGRWAPRVHCIIPFIVTNTIITIIINIFKVAAGPVGR